MDAAAHGWNLGSNEQSSSRPLLPSAESCSGVKASEPAKSRLADGIVR